MIRNPPKNRSTAVFFDCLARAPSPDAAAECALRSGWRLFGVQEFRVSRAGEVRCRTPPLYTLPNVTSLLALNPAGISGDSVQTCPEGLWKNWVQALNTTRGRIHKLTTFHSVASFPPFHGAATVPKKWTPSAAKNLPGSLRGNSGSFVN